MPRVLSGVWPSWYASPAASTASASMPGSDDGSGILRMIPNW
jgi:hypothetical protein